MARRKGNADEVIGQDSFLDVVANLVGILIILVMVIGARARNAIVVAEAPKPAAAATAEIDTESATAETEAQSAKAAADQVLADFQRIEAQLRQQAVELDYRQGERDRAQLLVTSGEQKLAAERAKLDAAQQAEFDLQKKLQTAEREQEDLQRQIGQAEQSLPETQIIDHLPTPMAKTVFGKELHLRLHAGRVCYVPWDEFVERLKAEMPSRVSRLREQDEYTDSIGPIGGFWMRYTLRKQAQVLQGKAAMAVQQVVSLDKFVLLAETEEMGETLEQALEPNSDLNARLAQHRPASTTITVWTYPDSFNEFRQLKRVLFERGYATAARPLPADHPIGGSPDGTRSAAQ